MKKRQHIGDLELEGVYAGLYAGTLLLVVEMLLAAVTGRGLLTPFYYAASIFMAGRVFQVSPWIAVPTGLLIYYSACAIWGFVYGLAASTERIASLRNRPVQVLVGAAAGVALWAFSFLVMGRLFYPWFSEAHPPAQLFLFVAFFGAPLGLLFAYYAERRPQAVPTSPFRP
jgi:hypothetical protein